MLPLVPTRGYSARPWPKGHRVRLLKGFMSNIRTFALALGALTLTGSLALRPCAAADEPLTLTQALQKAATGNVELRRQRILIQSAEAQFEGSAGTFDFRLSGDLTFSRRTTPPLSAADFSGGFTNTIGGNLNLSRLLETGGNVRLSLQQSTTASNARSTCGTVVGPAGDCTFYGNNVNLTFTHPLLRGFGAEIAQANIRRQRVLVDQAMLNRQMQVSNVLRDVITSYWELAYATQDLVIRRQAVDLAREQLRITNAQIEVGRLAPVDSAAVERAINDRQQEVVVSEQNQFFRTLELRKLFGIPSDPSLPVFSAQDFPSDASAAVDLGRELQRVMESNPQLRAIRMGLHLSEIDVQTALSTLKPQVDFAGQIGSAGRNSAIGQSLAQSAGLDNLVWSAGLTFDIPLENRLAKGQVRVAELAGERDRLEAGDLEISLRDLTVRLGTNIQTASRRIEFAKATVGFAQKNLEAEKARFAVGRSTNNDVLLRQQELKNAEIQVNRATVDLLNSDVALSAVTGEILERHGVILKGG